MTLTICVGSSGSGKTTFLNDVYRRHQSSTYVRQYHCVRPYIKVSKIPNFDPTQLPYWHIYANEGKDQSIRVGGTMAGKFYQGLSGGQRKLLIFELVYQRVMTRTGSDGGQRDLLLIFDEPYAGVTDDFVPFIVKRLNEMRKGHNLLVVTNDHVAALTGMADNTITVSAVDRTKVEIKSISEDLVQADRETTISALSLGQDISYKPTKADLKFFFDVEVMNPLILGVALFTVFCYGLFILTFWNAAEEYVALSLVASTNLVFFVVQPYYVTLVDWRNAISEEAEVRMHASLGVNKALKMVLALLLILFVSFVEFGSVNAVVTGFASIKYWVAMACDLFSLTFPMIGVGIYSNMPIQVAQLVGTLPLLLMIFFSTTFAPGAGVSVVKALRYLFPRFYFWCMLPGVENLMEGCPDEPYNMIYLVLSTLLGVVVFGFIMASGAIRKKLNSKRAKERKELEKNDGDFVRLQRALFGNDVDLSTFMEVEARRRSILTDATTRDSLLVPQPGGLREDDGRGTGSTALSQLPV